MVEWIVAGAVKEVGIKEKAPEGKGLEGNDCLGNLE